MTRPVEASQDRFELERLLQLFEEEDPGSVLEIGVWHGGTLWHWLQGGRTVVAVDDTMFEADDWQLWATEAGSRLHLFQGDSHDQNVVEQVGEFAPFEFLFIDAGHDSYSVRADWMLYGQMVASGGLVAFHDIQPRDGYGVSELWQELKPGHRTVEFWGGTNAYCGIGVLWP